MNYLSHTEDASLRFTEAIADFGSLIIERGPDVVLQAFREGYPMQAEQLQEAMTRPKIQIPALFKKAP